MAIVPELPVPTPRPVRVYVAAPWPLKHQAEKVGRLLAQRGAVVIARWLTLPDTPQDDDAGARMDLADIDASDALVLINPAEFVQAGTGGRHVEFGYALGKGKAVHIYGVRSNVFHQLSTVHFYGHLEDLLDAFTAAEVTQWL